MYSGSFSSISLIPFPDPAPAALRANITVETAHVPASMTQQGGAAAAGGGAGGKGRGPPPPPPGAMIGDVVIVATSNSSAKLSLVVDAKAFWVRKTAFLARLLKLKRTNDPFTKTGSGQTQETVGGTKAFFCRGPLRRSLSRSRASPPPQEEVGWWLLPIPSP